MHAMPQMLGSLITSSALRDHDRKFRQYFLNPGSLAIIPIDNSFGGIPSTDEADLAIRLPQFASDIDEQAALRDLDTIPPAREFQHLDPVLQTRAMKMFVWINARYDTNHFINDFSRSFGQSKVRSRHGIERARQHTDAFYHFFLETACL